MSKLVEISDHYVNKCREFAEASVDTSLKYYRWRSGKLDRDKLINDIFVGKMGEVGAYKLLNDEFGIEVAKPDFDVYEGRRKSFTADLTAHGVNFHCKTQSEESERRYGKSWLFQYSEERYGGDRLFKQDLTNEFIIPMSLKSTNIVEIHAIIDIADIVRYDMFDMPKLEWFKKTKRAVYWDKLKKLNSNKLWGLK